MDYKQVREYASNHRADILSSDTCGCYFCVSTFPPEHIMRWIDNDQTALYPKCATAAVIGSVAGYFLKPGRLETLREYYYGN